MPPIADYQLFLSMDLKSSDSVKKYIQIVEGKGPKKLVPAHIRGWSTNPREIMHRIRHFRRLGEGRQTVEIEKWTLMPATEKKKYMLNIEELVALKTKFITHEVKWEDVTPDFESLWTLEQLVKDAAKAKPKQAKKASSRQATPLSPSMRTRSSQHSPGTTAGSTSAVARAAVVSEPPAAPASNNENVDPQVQLLSASMRLVPEQLESEYCGLASGLELRTGAAQDANKRARHDIKRRIGTHAETLDLPKLLILYISPTGGRVNLVAPFY
jgi:hypothetical protein